MHESMRISVATGSMNRTESLRWALPSWLDCPEVDEIAIVDWSSRVPVHEELRDLQDPRLRFVRVEGQAAWCAAKCHNVEIAMTTGDALLRIDADVRIRRDFFASHPLLREHIFWNAWWRLANEFEDRHLAGTIYTRRANFLLVNGYNERLVSYGYEDDDLFGRMLIARLRRGFFRRETLAHLPHSDASRLEQIAPEWRAKAGGSPETGIGFNREIAQARPWTKDDRQHPFSVKRADTNLWICTSEERTC
jgi:hypothetical protein